MFIAQTPISRTALVFVNDIGVHHHIWGRDELKQKSPDGIFASEAISS
ncbi:MAG: hypothetical protein ACXWPG_07460 [Ktedonobacteraceae bacterium]